MFVIQASSLSSSAAELPAERHAPDRIKKIVVTTEEKLNGT
jgi:hypothetical protein